MHIPVFPAALHVRYAWLLLGAIVVLIAGCRPSEPAAKWNPSKQESKSLMLCGRDTKLFVDHTKAPSLLQVQFPVSDGATMIHYGDLQIQPWDQERHKVSIRPQQSSEEVIPGFRLNSHGRGYTASAAYYLNLKQGQRLILVTITCQGETQKFELFPSNHLLGYSD